MALKRVGLRAKNATLDLARKQFLNGDLVRYSPGVSYALQMGQSCIPCNFSYSGILEFDNIVRRLELDWWKIRAEVVQKVEECTGWTIPSDMDLVSRGDLRAASPSPESHRTTLGPHVDSEKELFAGLIYLKSPFDNSCGGDLVMYTLKRDCPKHFMSQRRRIPIKFIDQAKTISYGLNNAVFFINSPKSIHSVSARSGSVLDRRNINLSLECPEGYRIFAREDYVSEELSSQAEYGQYRSIDVRSL